MHLFHVFDTHHSGKINIEEFVAMLIAGDAKHLQAGSDRSSQLELSRSQSKSYLDSVGVAH